MSTIHGMAMNLRAETGNAFVEFCGQKTARSSGLSIHQDGSRQLTRNPQQSLSRGRAKM
jgi:hypothetical protein